MREYILKIEAYRELKRLIHADMANNHTIEEALDRNDDEVRGVLSFLVLIDLAEFGR